MRVLFWGTPDFAAPSLRALIGEGFEVCGVVTQPDRPFGRSRTLTAPPVKLIALEESVPVFQPSSPRDAELDEMITVMQPDVSVVVAYGHILPKHVIDAPARGTLNIHASLLPALRGAAPIQAAIRQGLPETGVSIMRMVPALDAGPVLLRSSVPILDDETYGELRVRLAELGAQALIEALALMDMGEAREEPQDDSLATYAPKVTRENVRVDWNGSARAVADTIRAYDPAPGAFTTLAGSDVKLFGSRVLAAREPVSQDSPRSSAELPGTVIETGERIVVACGSGSVSILDVQPAGKKRMSSAQWVRGRGVAAGDRMV